MKSESCRVDITPLLHLPVEELFAIFDDLEPGSATACSVAKVLHSVAAHLTGERRGSDGLRHKHWPPEVDAAMSTKRAVELFELAEALDGLGVVRGDQRE